MRALRLRQIKVRKKWNGNKKWSWSSKSIPVPPNR